MDLAIAIIGAAATAAAAIAAFGSWLAARKANATASQVARIEQNRRHQELTPDFDNTLTVRDTAADWADLRVALRPGPCLRLDEVTSTILDEADKDQWTHGLPDGLTQEEAELFVWDRGGSAREPASRLPATARPGRGPTP
jgi:hypothetical protein